MERGRRRGGKTYSGCNRRGYIENDTHDWVEAQTHEYSCDEVRGKTKQTKERISIRRRPE